MSLATDLTGNQQRLAEAGREASAYLRAHKAVIPAEVYTALQLHLIVIASETTKLKMNLGALRMLGELEQRPPEVTVESLELAGCMTPELDRIDRMDGIHRIDLGPEMIVTATREQVNQIGKERLVPMLPEHAIEDQSERFAQELAHSGDDTLKEDAA